jgi:two-component sensor histidine kinase
MLIGELKHRVRNILAVAQALVRRTLSENRPLAESRAQVAARLQALAQAHDLLVQSDRQGVPIRKVIKTELAPFGKRAQIDGVDFLLRPSAVQSLALVVHELTTNAAKHGALSTDAGTVRVTWAVKGSDGDARFHFAWQETGGPPARAPANKGFGTSLLEMAIPGDGVAPALIYAEDGFRYNFHIAVSAIDSDDSSQSPLADNARRLS